MDVSGLCRELSLALPVIFIIIQLAVYITLPDTVPQHVSDGTVDKWTEKFSLISIIIYLLIPLTTLAVASVIECVTKKRALNPVEARDRAIISTLYTCVIIFIFIQVDSAILVNV